MWGYIWAFFLGALFGVGTMFLLIFRKVKKIERISCL